MPKVTVIVPNYNHARFLEQRIQSILGQTYTDWELWLLDDGSTDDSRDVLQQYVDMPGVCAMFSERNSGNTFVQWNVGVARARGEYIWLAESDDFADPRFLEKTVAVLEAHPETGIVYSNMWLVDEQGNRMETYDALQGRLLGSTRWHSSFQVQGRVACADFFLMGNPICNASAVLFRKSVFDAVGGADTSLRLCGDWMTWVRMLMHSDLAYVNEPLSYFRHHAGSVRSRSLDNFTIPAEAYKVVRYVQRQVKVSPVALEWICQYLFNEWWTSWKAIRNPLRLAKNIGIYVDAFRADPRLHERMREAVRARTGRFRRPQGDAIPPG